MSLPKLIDNYRWVVVEETIQLVVQYPKDFTVDNIEFARNDGSWCSSNISSEIEEQVTEMSCNMCSTHSSKFIREATTEDIELRTEVK